MHAFAAAAAFGSARDDDAVVGLQRVQRQRTELPILQQRRQIFRLLLLHQVDDDDDEEAEEENAEDDAEDDVSGHGQTENESRRDDKHGDDVDGAKPAVFGSDSAETFGETNRHLTHERDREEEQNAGEIEEEMAESDLKSDLGVVSASGEGGHHGGESRADVGTQCQRVKPLDRHRAET